MGRDLGEQGAYEWDCSPGQAQSRNLLCNSVRRASCTDRVTTFFSFRKLSDCPIRILVEGTTKFNRKKVRDEMFLIDFKQRSLENLSGFRQ